MAKYEVKDPTPEEVQQFHQKYPVAVLEDGEPIKFCANQDAAEQVKGELANYETIEKRVEAFVQTLAGELDITDAEVWGIVHEMSEGPPRDI